MECGSRPASSCPWTHGVNPATSLGELDFGAESLAENDATMRWLDCLLHSGDPAEFQQAPVHLFVMGRNQWRDFSEWPPAGTRSVPFYLRAGGRLSPAPPVAESPDLCRGRAGERPRALRHIAGVPLPAADPVYGVKGPLLGRWTQRGGVA